MRYRYGAMADAAKGEVGRAEHKVTQASSETRSWLRLLTGEPGVVVVPRDGATKAQVSVDADGTARVLSATAPKP
jgi:hypothetical protein